MFGVGVGGSCSNGDDLLGAKDCTLELTASDIVVDFQWHFPMDFQWHLGTEFHLSVICSKGLSLFQWMFTGIVQGTASGIFQRNVTFVISGV